jgi:hypothetical protein
MDGMHTAAGTQRLKVYLVLHRHGNRSADGCFASVATIAKETGINRDDTCLTLKWLVENGWAVREARPGRTSTYYLRQDEPTHLQVGTHPEEATPPQVTPPTHLGVTPPTHPQVTQTRTQEQEPKNKNPLEVETPYPLRKGETVVVVGVGEEVRGSDACIPSLAPAAGGKVAADPQPQRPDPAPSPKRRMAKPPAFQPSPDDIPASLLPAEAPLRAFWEVKGGQRTQQAWNCLTGALERIWRHPDGGMEAVREQLDGGIQNGWGSITFANWQKYGTRPLAPVGSTRRGSATMDAAQAAIAMYHERGIA